MPCCKSTCSCSSFTTEQIESLKLNAQTGGLDPSVIADIISKWGPDALVVVTDALQHGMTPAVILEIITKFGPGLLQLLVAILKKRQLGESAVVWPPPPGTPFDTSLWATILEQIIPVIFQQFGPQILQQIQDAILNALKNQAKPA